MADQTRSPASPPAPPGSLPVKPYREVTLSALIFALVVGAIMNASITYAGLKIGFTIGGSAIAAVLGFGILRGILRKGTILETNIAQTVASAVNTSNSGIIFTVPVLLLLGISLSISGVDFWLITLAAMAGAVLGAAFIIPLRKQMIDIDRLRFPTGTGVAVILKSPGAGAKKAIVLGAGIAIGALIYLPVGLEQLGQALIDGAAANGGTSAVGEAMHHLTYTALGNAVFGTDQQYLVGEALDAGSLFGIPAQFQLIFAIAPFALGAGYITGRPGLLVLAGGILTYLILGPLTYQLGWMPKTVEAAGVGGQTQATLGRPLGIGLLLGGAIMGVLASLPAIREALKSVAAAGKIKGAKSDELGLKPLFVAVIAAIALLFAADYMMGSKPINDADPVTGATIEQVAATASHNGYEVAFDSTESMAEWSGWTSEQRTAFLDTLGAKPGWLSGLPSPVRALLIAIIGAAWIWLAGIIIAQCTGMTDWSPISGMALLTVVLVMLLAGTGAVVAAVLIGAALCVAITLAADMMQDLKTGQLVGAMPKRQQVTELCVVGIGPLIAMVTILIIAGVNQKQYGVPMGAGTPTAAPQAQALQAVITGVQGGEMPYALYGFGALLGALLGLGAFSGLGVLVGLSMYLPFQYIATYGIGCVINMIVGKVKGRGWAEDWGVPMAAGLIVGESLLALVINIIVLAQG